MEQIGKAIILRNGVRAVVLYGCGHFCYGERDVVCCACAIPEINPWHRCMICARQVPGQTWDVASMPAQMKIGETNVE